MRKQLILSAIILLSTAVNAQSVVLSCQKNNLLFPKQTFSTNVEELDISADKSEISGKNKYLLTGNATINSSQYYLFADTINVNKSNKIINASGNVKFQNDKLMLTSAQVVIKKQGDTTHASAQQVRFHYPDSKLNGQAQKITDDGTQQVFDSLSYSLCPLGNNDWQIKADKVTLNPAANRGSVKNATIEFFGVPIFYIPYHKWILQGRGSGLLAPSFSNYDELAKNKENGYQVRIPYYFNIAPDRDFLLTLNHLSTRGTVLEGVYRQLIAKTDYWQAGRFEIEGQYLPKDDITNDKRWLVDSKLNLPVDDKLNVDIKINRVSDSDYFKDIAHHNTSDSALYSQIDVAYRDNARDLSWSVFSESEQLINNGEAEYTRAPELSIAKGIQGLGGRYSYFSLNRTEFKYGGGGTKTTGVRTYAQANFKRSVVDNAYSLTPSLNFSTTDYNLNDAKNQRLSLVSFHLDSKLFLERETRLFGSHFIQTLSPRLSYRYTPEKNQNALPNFDSEEKDRSYESLFSNQKFTGIDRVNSANSFTLGLESDFINAATGNTTLSLKAAQTFHVDSQEINIDGNLENRRKYSDILAEINFTADNFIFNNALQFNPKTNILDEHDSAITYQLNRRKFLTLAHHKEDNIKSAELYGAYPINTKVHVFAGVNRSITDSITNKKTLGIAYESCCWALRLAHFKKHISGNDYDRVINFELVFKGLASTSPNLAKRLEEEIPNYLGNLNN